MSLGPCNSGLGFFRDDERALRNAVNYLALPPGRWLGKEWTA